MAFVLSEAVLLKITFGASVLALLYALFTSIYIIRQNPGNAIMQKISRAIRIAAKAFSLLGFS